MIKKIFPFLLLFSTNIFSQQIKLLKLNAQRISNDASINIYSIKIYNNTDKPICIPISNYFAYRLNANDTLELGDIYDEKDSVITVSLFWAKKDLEIDPQQMPSYPVIINPQTYLLTNIKFISKSGTKKMYFEFKHSLDSDLDYEKIISSYNTEPKFKWKKSLKFIETRVPIEL